MFRDWVKYLDERSTQLQQQVVRLLLERGEGQTAVDPTDIDVPEVPSPLDYLQIIQEAISDGRLHITAVQSPVEGRARSNSAFPNDMFPLPVMPPPPPTPTPKIPSPPPRNQSQDIPHPAPTPYQMPHGRGRDSIPHSHLLEILLALVEVDTIQPRMIYQCQIPSIYSAAQGTHRPEHGHHRRWNP